MTGCTDERIRIKLANEAEEAVKEDDLERASKLLDLYAKIAFIQYVRSETR